jgi:uncharacterized protein YyaL (SSP411 family)
VPLLRDIKDQLGSPYLLDHADNPVDWRMWDNEALGEAQRLDRPIFLSVGYASCHWCHVMAHESFEDPDVARLLNDSFVSIKVDREERPDVDALYMAATQLLSGHGGWPMSVFLLPDGRPFMAGTYYPPVDRHGQVGFSRLLLAMAEAWANQREAVVSQAGELRDAMEREIAFIDHLGVHSEPLDLGAARDTLRDELVARVDGYGGFGSAPKFPRPSYLEALLDYRDAETVEAAARTLDAMSREGLYDHVRGGFARYSVDAEWRVPHFEKMLSDQALLARAYLRASRAVTGHPEWRDVALDALHFVLNDLKVAHGYGSSLDADANGVEGSHVTWTPDEVTKALERKNLGVDVPAVLTRYSITSPGLFEGRSIPRLSEGVPFVTPAALRDALDALREARALRPQPARDPKVILEWNSMLASALVMTGDDQLIERALELLESLALSHQKDGAWWRTEHHNAFATASDVAWFIDAHVDAFEATGDDRWIERASETAVYLLDHYWDGEVPSTRSPHVGKGVFFQCDLVTDLLARPKEIFDGATPSSHAVTCRALARLALCKDDGDMLAIAERLVELAANLISSHPSAVPDLVAASGYALQGVEVVIPGAASALANHVRSLPMSRTVLVTGTGSSPLLEGRSPGWAYVCRAGACQLPVTSIDDLDQQLEQASL